MLGLTLTGCESGSSSSGQQDANDVAPGADGIDPAGDGDASGIDPVGDGDASGIDPVGDGNDDAPDPSGDVAVGDDAAVVDVGPPVPCETSEDCAGLSDGICTQAICDTAAGVCLVGNRPDGTPCPGDNPCIVDLACSTGECKGGKAAPPACGNKVCGLDACGFPCGDCPGGAPCLEDGTCDMEGLPSCDGLSYEGCCDANGGLHWCDGGSLSSIDCTANDTTCGWSVESSYFDCGQEGGDPTGTHVMQCPWEDVPDEPCADLECGVSWGEDCGTCPEASFCTGENLCQACSCEGKTCGEDGCGISCGSCAAGEICQADLCVEDPCGGTTFEGCCASSVVTWCEDGAIQEVDCATAGDEPMECGWVATESYYWCGGTGEDPTGAFSIDCDAEPPPPADEDPTPDAGSTDAVSDANAVDAPAGDAPAQDVGPEPTDAATDGDAASKTDTDAAQPTPDA
jgi:hypothetical protein